MSDDKKVKDELEDAEKKLAQAAVHLKNAHDAAGDDDKKKSRLSLLWHEANDVSYRVGRERVIPPPVQSTAPPAPLPAAAPKTGATS